MELSMIDAIYSAEVTLKDHRLANAILVFNQGQIHGADSLFVYKGCYAVVENSLSAAVVVDRYCEESRIDLPTGLTLVSSVDGKPEEAIRMELKRISKLDDH